MRATRCERRRKAGWVEPWLLAAFIVLALVPVGCDVFDQVALLDLPWAYWWSPTPTRLVPRPGGHGRQAPRLCPLTLADGSDCAAGGWSHRTRRRTSLTVLPGVPNRQAPPMDGSPASLKMASARAPASFRVSLPRVRGGWRGRWGVAGQVTLGPAQQRGALPSIPVGAWPSPSSSSPLSGP